LETTTLSQVEMLGETRRDQPGSEPFAQRSATMSTIISAERYDHPIIMFTAPGAALEILSAIRRPMVHHRSDMQPVRTHGPGFT
jgi:hypothetical protein